MTESRSVSSEWKSTSAVSNDFAATSDSDRAIFLNDPDTRDPDDTKVDASRIKITGLKGGILHRRSASDVWTRIDVYGAPYGFGLADARS